MLPPRLRMLITHTGSPDGHTLYVYTAGEVYDAHSTPPMTAHLAAIFLHAGWAEDADARSTPPIVAESATPSEPESLISAPPRRRKAGPTELKDA